MSESLFKPVVYAFCTAPLAEPELFEAAFAASTPDRRRKAARLRGSSAARLSLGGGLLARYALASLGCFSAAPFALGTHGKPFLPGCPYSFSLSHSGEWALCAVSEADIGCDVQEIIPGRLNIAKRYFSPEENSWIDSFSAENEQTAAFFRLWSLKESFLKVSGHGFALPLKDFSIFPGETITIRQSVDKRTYCFTEYFTLPGYSCAVCSAGPEAEKELRTVEVRELLSLS